jgi:hypothetical protein
MVVVVIVTVLVRYPVRMMLLDPRMVVLNPPSAIVPLVMGVIVAHARRRRVSI